ncbi:MAG: hypothetical protein HN368_21430, partial [Spirochaetales bacterium]|nr:hypothetical protein [Spirochaetales bacterium]
SEPARSFLDEAYSGTVFREDRICFSKKAVLRFIDGLKEANKPGQTPEPARSFGHGESWCCLNLFDSAAGNIRPAAESDLIRIVKFLDAYGVDGKVPPVSLTGFPPHRRDLEATRVCLENSPVYGAPTQIPGESELVLFEEMAAITARPMPVLAMLIVNPLSYDDRAMEFVLARHNSKLLNIETVGGLPSIGNTAPIVYPAAHMQTLAEDLAASMFIYAVTRCYDAPYLRGDPFDMKYGNFVVGGADYTLLDLACRKLHKHLVGKPREWGYLLSMSKKPDIQAAHERTAGCWLQALNGARWFKGSGQLSSDEVYSPEQVVIDRSIVTGVERLIRGINDEFSVEECVELVAQGVSAGGFLEQDQTLERFREFTGTDSLFPATNLGQWKKKGGPEVLHEAGRTVEETTKMNSFARPDAEINALRAVCKFGR